MTHDPAGNILVSITKQGKVVALPDRNGDGATDAAIPVIEGLNRPHGLAFRGSKLYIAEADQVATYDYDATTLKAANKKKIIDLPAGGNHFTRTILFTPDDKLLISVGSSCNVCTEKDWRRAAVLSTNPDGSDLKIFASGLRNSVFMALHPVNGKIWATEMGRDLIGDDIPPDEINILEERQYYGWPYCYGKNILDTFFHNYDHEHVRPHCVAPFEIPSHIDIPAHSAPLGLAFFPAAQQGKASLAPSEREEKWPEEYWHNLLVAYHGSWNRTEPTGYKIVRYKLDSQGQYLGEEDFITGWFTPPTAGQAQEGALGRPVDIMIQPGGKIYISDDKAGVIYRVAYNAPNDLIQVEAPKPNEIIRSPLTITGKARGTWYFEASFPIRLLDANGKEIAVKPAHAKGEWMITEFVPFETTLEFEPSATDTGTLVLEKDNPSGLLEHAAEVRIPVRFR